MIEWLLPEGSRRKRFLKQWLFDPIVPRHLSDRFIQIDNAQLNKIAESLKRNFFSASPEGWLATDLGRQDLRDHLLGRLLDDRLYRIPWIDQAKPLAGGRVLELGCGTGSSTVALAEQGAHVVAVDIDDAALAEARERCATYGLTVDFAKCSASNVHTLFSSEKFDLIVFWACLEHLTLEERLCSIAQTWQMLPSGGVWCITDTPNRLWLHDFHTSFLPFFMWLPDPLAIQYARFSPRQRFRNAFDKKDPADHEVNTELARWRRGKVFTSSTSRIGSCGAS